MDTFFASLRIPASRLAICFPDPARALCFSCAFCFRSGFGSAYLSGFGGAFGFAYVRGFSRMLDFVRALDAMDFSGRRGMTHMPANVVALR